MLLPRKALKCTTFLLPYPPIPNYSTAASSTTLLPSKSSSKLSTISSPQPRQQQQQQQTPLPYTPSPPPIHSRKFQSVRQFLLDRPRAMNALNLEMIHTITPQLKAWQESNLCKVVVLSNVRGSKAFCAGGDVKQVVKGITTGRTKDIERELKFFAEEYRMNHLISTTTKPYVSILNGITMGGGVGLSVHGHFRIATENTMIAMPETSIGLFPDVGGSFFLPRLDGELGTFLGLTGHRLKGEEAFIAGFATHYIPTDRLDTLMASLAELESDELSIVNTVIDSYSDRASLSQDKFDNWSLGGKIGALIDRTFKFDTVEEIFEALVLEGKSADSEISNFATSQLAILKAASPMSLKVTLRQLRSGASMDIASCFKMEYRMVRGFLESPDFIEGGTAKLIEKRAPVFTSQVSSITSSDVEKYFKRENFRELRLFNELTFFDYPHRTLSGLPTDRDVKRIVSGEGRRDVISSKPQSRQEVLEWISGNWGRYDTSVIGGSEQRSSLPTRLSLDGGNGKGKVGLVEKVSSILDRHTSEKNGRLSWRS